MPNGTTNKKRHGLVFWGAETLKLCIKFEPASNAPKTRDNNIVIVIHRGLNTGKVCVRVVKDRINSRNKVAS
jgi:hypothetical protein